ncbi:hypothetical protein D9619_005350 [Psilocybe cf. subviscida]|uniref:Uncharacterized protein n=1 Tax=Psilocybe cf. subviscida TaxID=2480587 RepID=A0A8H5BXJ8_9AGAR|nr:hypothetical protein D9619_005350 [Psilocybe cf. subviscida]
MYSDPNLDAPPPRSQFRRPWSPEPYTPQPPGAFSDDEIDYDVYDPAAARSHQHQTRREASEASVEALDLADYSRTLRQRQAEDPYPAFPSRIQSRPPSSFPPFMTSYEAMPTELSRGPTLTSLTTHSSEVHTPRRQFSLPVTPISTSHANSSRQIPHIVDPEVDISQFPRWTRNWYNHQQEQEYDVHAPHSATQLKLSPFDPAYVHNAGPYGYNASPQPLSSVSHDSRDVLPWSNEVQQYVDPLLKEERIRMLEREFGSKQNLKVNHGGLVDHDGKPLVGTVDQKGRLVTVGPKRRVFFRVLQIALAAGACIPAIYAAVAIKTDSKSPPPPANKPPVYVLYILSSVSLLVLLYMFFVRPCCCVRRKPRSRQPNMGMMVLPVGGQGDKKKKKHKGGKKGKGLYGPPGAQDVQVNLIVDPAAFRGQEVEDSDSEDGYDSHDGSMPGGLGGAGYETPEQRTRRKKRARNRRRKGIFEGMAMEEEWRAARSWAKRVAMVDAAGLVVWGAAFVFILTGKRCPSGGFNGWCNAYNTSTASACLLAVAFGVTTFFDVQDLHASKQSPRTRV